MIQRKNSLMQTIRCASCGRSSCLFRINIRDSLFRFVPFLFSASEEWDQVRPPPPHFSFFCVSQTSTSKLPTGSSGERFFPQRTLRRRSPAATDLRLDVVGLFHQKK